MRSEAKWVAIAGAALSVAGCAQVDPGLGEAVKYDQAIQTINPDPVYPANAALPGGNGATSAAAAKRYRSDAVKPLEKLSTSSGATGNSGGAGPK